MNLTLAVILATLSPAFAALRGSSRDLEKPTPSPAPFMFNGNDFIVEADLNFDATLPGNDQVIGVHLHTGSSTVNGPVNIILCGSAPLPSQNGPCDVQVAQDGQTGRFKARFLADSSLGAWDLGITNATAVPGAKTIADGAATTPETFLETLRSATQAESLVYINFHTNYSLTHNDGKPYGLARAQLRPVKCSSKEPTVTSMCLGTIGQVSSDKTNQVEGLPAPFPPNAGVAKTVKTLESPFNSVMVIML